jgi:hypothetical protein
MMRLMSLQKKNWNIQNDTLSIELETQPGVVMKSPDEKVVKQNDDPSFTRYFVWEISDSLISIENLELFENSTVKERLNKSDKIGFIN